MFVDGGIMKDEIKKISKECYRESSSVFTSFFEKVSESHRFYLSKAWNAADMAALKEKKLPMLNINLIKKNVDTIIGLQRQNRTSLRLLPIDKEDELLADILTPVLQWNMSQKMSEFAISDAYKDAVIGGLGWLDCHLSYNDDLISGDIIVKHESPFNIFIDPYIRTRDLEDCDYIIRRKLVSRDKLKAMYPDFKKDIENINFEKLDSNSKDILSPHDRKQKLYVTEFWYRENEKRQVIINTQNPEDQIIWREDIGKLKAILAQSQTLTSIEKTTSEIKLAIIIQDDLIIYNGPSPYSHKYYPLIPVFGFWDISYDTWEDKCQGIVDVLKDPQREKNKRRSNIMYAINTMPFAGWLAEKGAVDDVNVLKNAGGMAKYIEVNSNRRLEQIQPPQMPAGLFQLEQMFSNDIREVGMNPDLLGMIGKTQDSGKTIQLRQMQGIAGITELTDNLSYSTRHLAIVQTDYILNNYTPDKMQRIIGAGLEVPPDINDRKDSFRYDVHVDEVSQSPTHRFQTFTQLMEAQQYGIPIPLESLVEYMDLPSEEKAKIIQNYQNQMQQQQAMQMQEQGQMPPDPQQMMPQMAGGM